MTICPTCGKKYDKHSEEWRNRLDWDKGCFDLDSDGFDYEYVHKPLEEDKQ